MSEEKKVVYGDNSIQELAPLEHIARRPSMYIESIGEMGIFKIDREGGLNIFDEAQVGFGDHCNVYLYTDKNLIVWEDFARGIPVNRLKDVYSKLNTGGKFDREAYSQSAGQNGVGAKAITALSTWMQSEVYREPYFDGTKNVPAQHAILVYENRECKKYEIEDLPNGIPAGKHQGTTLSYIVDEKILQSRKHSVDKLCDWFDNTAYAIPGFAINFYVDGERRTFKHDGGVAEHLKNFIKSKDLKIMMEPLYVEGTHPMGTFKLMFTYGPNNTGNSNIVSHVNCNATPSHGTHVSAFRAGAGMALTQYIQETDGIIPKQFQKLNVSGALLSDNLIAIVAVGHQDPLYSGQTKESFSSTDVDVPIKSAVRNAFLNWLRKNPNQAKKLVNLAIDYAKYEEERKKLKKNLIETKSAKSAFGANAIDLSKFTMCRSTDPDRRELFVVEGASAGGQVSEAQDHDFQALYKLRGKLKNVANGSTTNLSKEILDLIQLLGIGFPGTGKLNYDNLQYKSFILLTDADDDGAHIVTLLLAFIYTFYPEMIRRGHVFIANPPIKKITLSNKQSFFIHTEKDFDFYMEEFICNTFKLCSEKTGKELSEGLFRTFIKATTGYNNLIDNHASALAINPDLLERIIVNINILSQCTSNKDDPMNEEFKAISGYDVRRLHDSNLFMFDKGIYHASLRLDKEFLSQHFDVITQKLYDIHIYGVYLKGIKSSHEYHGTVYQLCEYMNSVLGPKIQVTRFKGLGEMSSADLAETVTNPTTRRLTQVTMEYAAKAEKAVRIFMTDADIKFKRLFYAGEIDFA